MDWRGFVLRVLVPVLPLRELPRTLVFTLAGALLAGVYGVAHDQVTYSLGPEYFTCLKFDQFAWAKPGWGGPRLFAGEIGFLATWWVGALVAWILVRVSLWHGERIPPVRIMGRAFVIVFVISAFSGLGGWLWGRWRETTGYHEGWHELMRSLGVSDANAFMSVAYIHNASYLGGMLGMLGGLVYLARYRQRVASDRLSVL
ncbi:MAG: hypothetical protein KDN18_24610 [Verrucomicrobiae bacterium]|nr:hypothetical protein [Verrucomicrobiae bacterium]